MFLLTAFDRTVAPGKADSRPAPDAAARYLRVQLLEPLRVRLPGGSLPERTGVTQNLLF